MFASFVLMLSVDIHTQVCFPRLARGFVFVVSPSSVLHRELGGIMPRGVAARLDFLVGVLQKSVCRRLQCPGGGPVSTLTRGRSFSSDQPKGY